MMKPATFIASLTSLLLAISIVARSEDQTLRDVLIDAPLTERLGGDTTRPLTAPNAFSFQAANAPRTHQRPFSFGNRVFNTNWVLAPGSVKNFDGLGPLYNRVSCSGCHTKDGRGEPPATGIGPMDGMLLRISMPGEGPHGGPNPVPHYGDQLSERSALGVAAEGIAKVDYVEHAGSFGDGTAYRLRAPRYGIVHQAYGSMPGDMLVSARVAPQMIGLGLLEAVELQTLQALADPHDADGDGISGRANLVWNAARGLKEVGRFGWKAGQPDLINQNAAAALGDIGLTTSLHPTENCAVAQVQCLAALSGGTPEINDGVLQKLTLYTATLAVPAQRNAGDPSVVAGQLLFRDFGCAACHVPTLRSGAHDLPELARQTFHPFTDLLLHDMGDGLADNRPEFLATGREWRTPPLWGLGLIPRVNGHDFLLHDGRARGSAEAILWHGGEAKDAKERFRLAPKAERDQLIAFLNSL